MAIADKERVPPSAAHFVQFFAADNRLVQSISRFARAAVAAGRPCIVIATGDHRSAIDAALTQHGLRPESLREQHLYISLDAELMLSTFMSDGQPYLARFHGTIGLLMQQAASSGQPVRVLGRWSRCSPPEVRPTRRSGWKSCGMSCAGNMISLSSAPTR